MTINQLQTQTVCSPLLSVQQLWQQTQRLASQIGESLLQRLTIASEPQVVMDCDLNNQITIQVKDPHHGTFHTFTNEEDARIWLEKGRFM